MEEDRVASVLALDFESESSSLAVLSAVPRSTKAQLMGPDHAGGAVPWSRLMGPLGTKLLQLSHLCEAHRHLRGLEEEGRELRQVLSRGWLGSAEEEPMP